MNIKYRLGTIISLPLLPLMYYQGKRIRASVPKLPEANGIEGMCCSEKENDKTFRINLTGETTIAGVGVLT